MTSKATDSNAEEHTSRHHPGLSWPRCPPPRSAPHMRTSEQIPEPHTAGSRAAGNQARIPAHHNPYRYELPKRHACPVLARRCPNPGRQLAQTTEAHASGQPSTMQVSRCGPHFFAPAHGKAKQGCFTEFHQQLFGAPMRPLSSLTTPPAGTATTRNAFIRLEVTHG